VCVCVCVCVYVCIYIYLTEDFQTLLSYFVREIESNIATTMCMLVC